MACLYTNLMSATLVGFVASHTIFIAMNVLIIYRVPFQTAVWNGLSIAKKCSVKQLLSHTLWLFTEMVAVCSSRCWRSGDVRGKAKHTENVGSDVEPFPAVVRSTYSSYRHTSASYLQMCVSHFSHCRPTVISQLCDCNCAKHQSKAGSE